MLRPYALIVKILFSQHSLHFAAASACTTSLHFLGPQIPVFNQTLNFIDSTVHYTVDALLHCMIT